MLGKIAFASVRSLTGRTIVGGTPHDVDDAITKLKSFTAHHAGFDYKEKERMIPMIENLRNDPVFNNVIELRKAHSSRRTKDPGYKRQMERLSQIIEECTKHPNFKRDLELQLRSAYSGDEEYEEMLSKYFHRNHKGSEHF
jgi:hypothetical protein